MCIKHWGFLRTEFISFIIWLMWLSCTNMRTDSPQRSTTNPLSAWGSLLVNHERTSGDVCTLYIIISCVLLVVVLTGMVLNSICVDRFCSLCMLLIINYKCCSLPPSSLQLNTNKTICDSCKKQYTGIEWPQTTWMACFCKLRDQFVLVIMHAQLKTVF